MTAGRRHGKSALKINFIRGLTLFCSVLNTCLFVSIKIVGETGVGSHNFRNPTKCKLKCKCFCRAHTK